MKRLSGHSASDTEPGRDERVLGRKNREVAAGAAQRHAPGSAGRPLAEDAGGRHDGSRRGETHRNTARSRAADPRLSPRVGPAALAQVAPQSRATTAAAAAAPDVA